MRTGRGMAQQVRDVPRVCGPDLTGEAHNKVYEIQIPLLTDTQDAGSSTPCFGRAIHPFLTSLISLCHEDHEDHKGHGSRMI